MQFHNNNLRQVKFTNECNDLVREEISDSAMLNFHSCNSRDIRYLSENKAENSNSAPYSLSLSNHYSSKFQPNFNESDSIFINLLNAKEIEVTDFSFMLLSQKSKWRDVRCFSWFKA